jgi:hypothetical protein
MSFETGEEQFMAKSKGPPCDWLQWMEYIWLCISNPTFRNSRDRRRAYYEHCLARSLSRPWS